MQSLKRKTMLWEDAKRSAERDRQRAAAARTGQVARSTVDVYGEPTQLDQMFEEASDTAALTSEQEDAIFILDEDQANGLDQFLDGDGTDIEDVLDAGELGMGNTESDADRWAEQDDSAEGTHEAHMDAIRTNELVTEAQTAADEALAEALKAAFTADGKNSIYAGMTEPEATPGAPFVNGDLWYVTDAQGRMVMVRIWNGTQWAGYQFVADEVLVPGSVGPTVIKDGSVVTQKLAATAIDGMTITGALMRTAPSGQRMQFDVNGLRAFTAAGAVSASLNAASGGLELAGSLVSRASTTGERATVGAGAFVLDHQSRPGSISLSAAGLIQVGAGTPLVIAHDSAGINSPIQLVASGNNRIQMLSSVEFLGDIDWTDLSTAGAYPYADHGARPQIKRTNDIVYVRGRVKRSDASNFGTSSAGYGIATIPASLRPAATTRQALSTTGSPGSIPYGHVEVNAGTGEMRAYLNGNTPWIGFDLWWSVI